jgi:beta-lactamase class A
MIAAAALAMAGIPLAAQEAADTASTPEQTPLEARAEQVVAVINGSLAPQEVFTDAFLAAVPPDQLRSVSAGLTAQMGRAVAIETLTPRDGSRAMLTIRFERGIGRGVIGIDPSEDDRIGELLFNQFDSLAVPDDTPDKIAADLAALPGSVNAWFAPLDGGAPVISLGADQRLALGSTFKLYVLAALAEDVKAGKRKWTDVVPLTERSYPSGKLQDWPEGSPLTLHTLASLMISISDNTATDQLIAVLGKERILKLMRDSGHSDPAANDPFLTTRLLFLLKASDAARLERWRSGNAAQRSATEAVLQSEFLAGGMTVDRINAAFAGGPKALDIEWFASPADLAKLLAHMRRTADPKVFEIMAINPSATPAIKANWDYIGFKGGSEPGVINLTWLLRDKAGRDHVLTLGWNNPAASLDEGKLNAIAQRILLLPPAGS